MTMVPGVPLEVLRVFTALGIQCWDQALDRPVTDGLYVAAQSLGADFAPRAATRTGSGIYAFQGLPGLQDVEYPLTDEEPPTVSPARKVPFAIMISDTLRRFLPEVFVVELPLDYPGVFLSNTLSGSPAEAARSYLFSAASRPVAPGVSVVRADLWDREADVPASHASMEVFIEGGTWTGVADDHGRATVQLPTPLVQRLRAGSPPGLGSGPIAEVNWPIEVRVRHQPDQLRFPLRDSRGAIWPWVQTPSLKTILDEAGFGEIWQRDTGPPATSWTGILTYSEELILRTEVTGVSKRPGTLLVTRAA